MEGMLLLNYYLIIPTQLSVEHPHRALSCAILIRVGGWCGGSVVREGRQCKCKYHH